MLNIPTSSSADSEGPGSAVCLRARTGVAASVLATSGTLAKATALHGCSRLQALATPPHAANPEHFSAPPVSPPRSPNRCHPPLDPPSSLGRPGFRGLKTRSREPTPCRDLPTIVNFCIDPNVFDGILPEAWSQPSSGSDRSRCSLLILSSFRPAPGPDDCSLLSPLPSSLFSSSPQLTAPSTSRLTPRLPLLFPRRIPFHPLP